MSHLVLELLLWIVFSFFVGCVLGCLFRRLFGAEPELVIASAATKPAATKHTPLRAPASAKVAAAPSAKPATAPSAKPATAASDEACHCCK